MEELVIENNDSDDRELIGNWVRLTETEFKELIEVGDIFEIACMGLTFTIKFLGYDGTCRHNERVRYSLTKATTNHELLTKSLCAYENSCHGNLHIELVDGEYDKKLVEVVLENRLCGRESGSFNIKPLKCTNFTLKE